MAPEEQPEAVLTCADLAAWFAEGGERVEVLAHLSLRVMAGEVLGVFGPNGCGKSTLARALLGLHQERAGRVTLGAGGRVGWVPQAIRESFFSWASVRENVLLTRPAGNAKRQVQLERIASTAQELGVVVDLRARPPQLSDGMLQQVAMVRALACEPRLLVADECFSALDVDAVRRLRGALRRRVHAKRMGALLVLHDLDALLELAHRVLVIERRPFTLEGETEPSARLLVNTRFDEGRGDVAADHGLLSIVPLLLGEPTRD